MSRKTNSAIVVSAGIILASSCSGPGPNTDETSTAAAEATSDAPAAETPTGEKWIGVGFATLADVRELFSDSLGVPIDGVVITTGDNTPAVEAGLASGDIIAELSGKKIASAPDFERWFNSVKIGESHPVTFYAWSREGKQKVFRERHSTITIGSREPTEDKHNFSKGYDKDFAALVLGAAYDVEPKRLTPVK